jgi:hypothetical protein
VPVGVRTTTTAPGAPSRTSCVAICRSGVRAAAGSEWAAASGVESVVTTTAAVVRMVLARSMSPTVRRRAARVVRTFPDVPKDPGNPG